MPDALAFLLINFISTLLFFLIAGGFSAWVFHARFSGSSIRLLVEYGFVAFAACFVVMMVGLFRPDLVARFLEAAAGRLRPMNDRWWARTLAWVFESVASTVDQYRSACTRFISEAPLLPVASFVLTVVLYLNKFTLGWLVMRGLGVHGSYVTTVALQALLHFILYVAPSPGGSGIAELSTGAVMALLMPPQLRAPFTLAYRFFLLYLPAAVGAFVLMAELRPHERSRPVPEVTKGDPVRAAARTAVVALALLLGGVAQTDGQSVRPVHTPAEAEALVVRGLLAP